MKLRRPLDAGRYIGFNVRFNPNLGVIAASDASECEWRGMHFSSVSPMLPKRLSGTLPTRLQRRKMHIVEWREREAALASILAGNQISQILPLMRFYSSRNRLT